MIVVPENAPVHDITVDDELVGLCVGNGKEVYNLMIVDRVPVGATVVVTLDADGQHLPEEVEHVVRPILTGEADIVIGSRYLVPGCNVPKPRVWGHRFFNQLTRITSGVAVTDSQSGYRAFSPAAIQAVSFCSNGFSVESEMQFIAHENHLRLVEVPITILYNDKPKRSVISQGLHVLGGVVQITGQYRPLLYFGVTGILLMLAGLGLAVHVYVRYEDVHLLATGNALVSLLLTIVGTVLFSTGFTLHSIRGLLTDRLKTPPKRSRGGLFWKLK
jgi:glycosyltransferase involved in cell wall biosynthesis